VGKASILTHVPPEDQPREMLTSESKPGQTPSQLEASEYYINIS